MRATRLGNYLAPLTMHIIFVICTIIQFVLNLKYLQTLALYVSLYANLLYIRAIYKPAG